MVVHPVNSNRPDAEARYVLAPRAATRTCRQRAGRSFTGFLAAMLIAFSGSGAVMAAAPTPGADTAGIAVRYTANARFLPDQRQLTGTLTLDWTNATGQTQPALPFRLYPNAPAYQQGGTVVGNVLVDGQPADTVVGDDPTTLRVMLPSPVPAGEPVRVDMDFTTTIPTGTTMAVDVLHGDSASGWWLADWLPILAGWEPGGGWYLAEPGSLGNPTFADAGTWHLTLTLPNDYLVIATGAVESDQVLPTGERQVEIVTPPARDLTLVLLPATTGSEPVVTERMVADTLVRVTLPVGYDDRFDVAGFLLDTVADVLPYYLAWLGPLPGNELDLTGVTATGYHGIAWSGLIWLNLAALFPAGAIDPDLSHAEFVLAHELAHLWVNLTVGSNNNVHNFLSESLASHLAILALNERGDGSGAKALATQAAAPFLALLERGEDGIVDNRTVRPDDLRHGYALIYGKGVLGFEAVRQAMGHDAYIRALQHYTATYRFDTSTPEDLLAIIESVAGQDISTVWNHWFNEATSTPEDVEAILQGFPGA